MPAKPKSAMECALGLLVVREHGAAELVRKLRTKGYPKADVEEVLARLQEQGTQSDARYAAARARYRATVSKWGWAKIALELRAAGIDSAHVDAAKQELKDDGVSFAVLAKKVAKPDADKQKALARLLRRGYSMDEAKAALDAAGGGE